MGVRLKLSGIILMVPLLLFAQPRLIKVNKQQKFQKQLPAGNFSGITWLGDDRYALVSDKGDDGFYVFRLQLDTKKGKIKSAENVGFFSTGKPNCDAEGIAYVPETNTLFIGSEQTTSVRELSIDGKETGRQLEVPEVFLHHQPNRGLESLTYDARNKTFWTVSESTLQMDGGHSLLQNGKPERLRIQSFDGSLEPRSQYAYLMDTPKKNKDGRNHVHGVSELTALPDGRLIVLEREFYVPKKRVGASVVCKLYVVNPSEGTPLTTDEPLDDNAPFLSKTLLCEWKTRMNLLHQDIANYEGMCLGPQLPDGRQTLILVADSQNRYGGLMRDWFKCILLDLQGH
ncbi:MAG: esterase-like activity of phytase family protein [Prevotella sp.]|nr:esterase-like activity of phytase family protein [Prevotella sp.]